KRLALPMVWALLCVAVLSPGWGCSKRAVSSSGDQSAAVMEPAAQPPAGTTQPDFPAAVLESNSPPVAPVETAREMTQPETPATPSPEPVPVQPVPAEPVPAEPTPAERTAIEPSPTEPMPVEPVPSQLDMPAAAPAAPPAPAQEPPAASLPPPAAPVTEPPKTTALLGDVFFDFDRYTIRNDAQPVLESNAAWIKDSGAKTIVIEGHCDERGTQAYNLVLGEKRAKATQRYLHDLGIPLSRLKTVSYGEMRPFCKEHSEDCYQSNRRAHFVPQ
ncbi:MAG TPA: OmpA family protein, partial [Nitrospira sp.]|nr:OmpA family protein [Nitrospira sp.]